jgi:hypothetical protein
MVKSRGPPGKGWRSFLRNHPPNIAAMDLFVVPTIGCVGCTSNNGGIPWDEARPYLIAIGTGSMAALSRADCAPWASGTKPAAPASHRQNGFAERLIGSIRREWRRHRESLHGDKVREGSAALAEKRPRRF